MSAMTEHEIVDAFLDAMRDAGLEPEFRHGQKIEIGPNRDGKPHRFHVSGDSKGSRNGWYVLFVDGIPAGEFGSWKSGYRQTWCLKNPTELTPEERRAIDKRMADAKAAREKEQREREGEAARLANLHWESAVDVVGDDHPYLKRKGVVSHGLRAMSWPCRNSDGETYRHIEDSLLVPLMVQSGKIVSLQAIFPAVDTKMGRDKDFLSGGKKAGAFYMIGRLAPGATICICEGYATAATIHEATGWCCVVAFDAYNVVNVAKVMREAMPNATFVIAADNDRWTETPVKNPGITYATRASQEINARVVAPEFEDLDGRPTDFNDLHKREGITRVQAQLFPPAPKPLGTKNQLQPANDNVPEDHIADLNRNHAVVLMADKAVILRETHNDRDGREVRFLPPASLKTFYANRTATIEVMDQHGRSKTKHVPVVDDWVRSPRRRSYEGVTFAPANNAPEGFYNLWRGYAVEPQDAGVFAAGMKCRRLLSHLKSNVCGGNREHFRYLLAWTADMLQDPDEKKGVALVLRGDKGVGKSTFADVLRKLLGDHAIKVSHMRHLTGNFNRHLSDKLLIVAEESFWAGDKNDEGPLKDMITSDTLTVEAKGVDAVEIRSLCRIIMITNSEWAVPATSDERRYFVLDVGSRHRQDHGYFAALHEQLDRKDREGLRAFLALMLNLPLDRFNLRKVPETAGLRTQRALSLDPHDQFIFDALLDRSIAGVEWDSDKIVEKAAVYDAYIEAARKRGKSHLMPANVFARNFMQATGATQTRPRDGYNRVYSWKLPGWREAAEQFEKARKVDVVALPSDAHPHIDTPLP